MKNTQNFLPSHLSKEIAYEIVTRLKMKLSWVWSCSYCGWSNNRLSIMILHVIHERTKSKSATDTYLGHVCTVATPLAWDGLRRANGIEAIPLVF